VIVDTNVNLSRWPFRHLSGTEPAELVRDLRKHHITQCWVGSFDGIFHKDLSSANARLASECQTHGSGLLLPFGSVNPKLPDWQEDLRRCSEQHRMRGIRLHPNYHGYTLADPVFSELLNLAAARGLIVQLALCVEDERTQHPLVRVPPVDLAPLPDLIKAVPKLRIQLLNCYPQIRFNQLRSLATSGNVHFEISMAEGVGGVARWIDQLGLKRIMFGSHYPFFYLESALLKIQEAGLDQAQRTAIFEDNAKALLAQQ